MEKFNFKVLTSFGHEGPEILGTFESGPDQHDLLLLCLLWCRVYLIFFRLVIHPRDVKFKNI